METPSQKNANVRMLACLVDIDGDGEGDYRVLVDDKYVKHVTTAPGTFRDADESESCFGPVLVGELLPQLLTGDWNKGHVAIESETRNPTFVETTTVQFGGVKNLWHENKLNELDFTRQDCVGQRVHISTHPELEGGTKSVLVKLAVWPWEIPHMEAESAIYKAIHDTGIGPKFLGYLTEGKEGRVIGFVTEWIEDARAAGLEDIDGCRKALSQLHKLGIRHGDINKYNFLVKEGQDVILIDFEVAEQDSTLEELEEEMSTLENHLADKSFRGGIEVISE